MDHFASLTALRAFETVVRTGSITAAADDLSVTHSAVSHQIRKLEKDLGLDLLVRQGRGVAPSPTGEKLARELSTAFRIIADAVRSAAPEKAADEITVSCTGTFLLHWLIPRLYRFKAAEPGIQLKLVEEFQSLDFSSAAYDVAIRIGRPPWPRSASIRELEAERIGPVVSRDLAERKDIMSSKDLSRIAMVHTRTRPTAWNDWAGRAGVILPPGADGTWFDHYYFLLEGVRAGLGIGVVPELLARDDLSRGHLLAPLGFVDSGNSFVVATQIGDDRAAVVAFRNWLTDEFKATLDPLD